ncbi:MAG: SGNH/GDSL hydrolase family protein [Clostridia bacterium]|nr:SGNH/GDSL hydrolase family protein [Clostridia bacterium]
MPTHTLDGKRIIFIGNSYIYWGNVTHTVHPKVCEQSEREGDTGYFYQICLANGENVSVCNWTFGSHGLHHLLGDPCAAGVGCDGVDHLSFLLDRHFDYVVFCPGGGPVSEAHFEQNAAQILSLFKAANPNAKFVCLGALGQYGFSSFKLPQEKVRAHYKELAKQGVTIADWGTFVYEIMQGKRKVEGATEPFDRNSFVVCRNEADQFHPNPLSGYIASLLLYCLLSGKPAFGQPYAFACDGGVHPSFDAENFVKKNYAYENAQTNYPAIFASRDTMAALQKAIDIFLRENR